ncbi:hypothetical protein AGMMS50230_10880 [Spirochaetia bacterium]|nr:hypothetical protein AGMMS50230_10880 [Spirochaetia bacterium]
MKQKAKPHKKLRPLAVLFVVISVLILATVCNSTGSAQGEDEDPPIITSATYQHTLYNGRPQSVDVRSASDDAPPFVITYFRSEDDMLADRGGTKEIPVDVGSYYVRIERPAGNGYREGTPVKVEYTIQKAFFPITAKEKQDFRYDGSPKPVFFEAPADISVEYYSGEQKLAGPPVQRGTYRVVLSYAGDVRYMGASKEVELVIR